MNRAYRRAMNRRLGKNKAAVLFRTEEAETSGHPLHLPKNWHLRHQTVVYEKDGTTFTLPGSPS